MFQRIVDLCRTLTAKSAPRGASDVIRHDDRRAWARYPSSAEVTVQGAGEETGASQIAQVRDVSRGGIKLIVRNVYTVGDMVRIDLPGAPEVRDSILACVIQVRMESDDTWAVGCVFCEELTDDELGSFGASRVKAPAEDSRSFVRFPCNVKATYERVDDSGNETADAEVENVSATGIGLLLDRKLELGSLLNLHLRNPARTETRTILACIVHVTQRPDGKCLHGCNFIRELAESDMKALF
jgi:hypothetical protein